MIATWLYKENARYRNNYNAGSPSEVRHNNTCLDGNTITSDKFLFMRDL